MMIARAIAYALVWALGWLSLWTCWAATGRRRTWCAHALGRPEWHWRAWVWFFDAALGREHCREQREKWE